MRMLFVYFAVLSFAFSFSKKTESSSSSSSSVYSQSSSAQSPDDLRGKILFHVQQSDCYKKHWKDRGQIPLGFLQGMAINFYKNKDEAVRPLGLSAKDALMYYGIAEASKIAEYTFLVGLSMRESSGRHCVGRDSTATNTDAETCEAGAFQFSYNSRSADPELKPLIEYYSKHPDQCELLLFSKNVTCKPSDWKNHGSGAGVEFQSMSKKCPVFAVEYAAVLIRTRRSHFGPINRKEVEYSKDCLLMFKEIAEF